MPALYISEWDSVLESAAAAARGDKWCNQRNNELGRQWCWTRLITGIGCFDVRLLWLGSLTAAWTFSHDCGPWLRFEEIENLDQAVVLWYLMKTRPVNRVHLIEALG